MQWLKPHIEFNTQESTEAEKKNNGKDVKALHKLVNNTIYGKTMENLRNRINVKLGNNEKDYLIVHQNQAICLTKYLTITCSRYLTKKRKLALKINKHAYIGMCILELSKVLMYEFR